MCRFQQTFGEVSSAFQALWRWMPSNRACAIQRTHTDVGVRGKPEHLRSESMLRSDELSVGESWPNLRRRSAAALATLFVAFGGVPGTKADVLATATRTAPPFVVRGGVGPFVIVPLTDSNSTELVFNTVANGQTVVITFNAECKVVGGGYLAVVIDVDGQPANPRSGTDFALCTTAPGDALQPVGAVRQSVFVVPNAGAHSVRVTARGVNGPASGGGQLDDTSLVVEQ